MRLSAIAACTLATLTAGERINETGQYSALSTADKQPEVDGVTYEVVADSSPVTAIAHPERVFDALSGFATAPAFAAEAPPTQATGVPSKRVTTQQKLSPTIENGKKPTAKPAIGARSPRSAAASISKPGLSNPTQLPNFWKLTAAQVMQLQRSLKQKGFDPGAIDGMIGPQTQSAISAFQKTRQLQVDGIVGPKTWSALFVSVSQVAAAPATKKAVGGSKASATTILPSPRINPTGTTTAQPQPTQPAQPQLTSNQATPEPTQVSFNLRLAAGFITGFSIPLTMMLLWQMIQTMRLSEKGEGLDGYSVNESDDALQRGDDLPAEDQLKLEGHCREIAAILSKNAVTETVSSIENPDQALRVQFLKAR